MAIYRNMRNIHGMFIKIKHRNLETRKTRNDFFVQVRNFLLHSSLKVLRHKERERHSLSILAVSSALPPTRVVHATKATGLASASKRKPTVFSTLTFSKSPKILRALPVRDVIRTR